MKKLLVVFLLFTSSALLAQAYPTFRLNHEVKFNIGLFLATTSIEGSYEHYISEDTSIGGTVYFDDDATDFKGNFGISGNFRAYFGYKHRAGFFAEAFAQYYSGEEEQNPENPLPDNEYNTVALGLGGGSKWATRSEKFTLEIFGGFGRNINPERFQDAFMYRGGLSIGFRF